MKVWTPGVSKDLQEPALKNGATLKMNTTSLKNYYMPVANNIDILKMSEGISKM